MEDNSTSYGNQMEVYLPAIDTTAVDLSKKILYPILLPTAVIGYTLAALMMRRNAIGRHSSAIYLIAIFTYDKLSIVFWYFVPFLVVVDKNLEFDNTICKFIMAMAYIGRAGTFLTAAGLALERALVLLFPTKYQSYSTPRTAFLICFLILLVSICLSGVSVIDRIWLSKKRICISTGVNGPGTSPSDILYITTITLAVSILLILHVIIGIMLYRRRVHRSQDPVQNALAAARIKTKQLNKVNLIAFVMTLTCFCEIIPILIIVVLKKYNLFYIYQSQLFAQVVFFFAPILLASKPYLLALISPKIRKELWELLRCKAKDSRLRELGVDVKALKPKQVSSQNSRNESTSP